MRQVTGIASLIAAVVAARLAVMMFFDLYPNRMLHFALLAGFLLIGGIYAFSRPRAALNTYLVGGVVMLAVTIGQLYSLTWGYRYTPGPDPAVVRGWLDLYWPWIAVLFGLALLSYRTWRQEQASAINELAEAAAAPADGPPTDSKGTGLTPRQEQSRGG